MSAASGPRSLVFTKPPHPRVNLLSVTASGGLDMPSNTATALITGGTGGIGRATARKLAELGIHVLAVGRDAEGGKKTIGEIRAAGGEADLILADLQDAASANTVVKKAIELGNGHVDILINNVGIYPFGPTHEMTEEQFDRVFSINVKVPYFLSRLNLPNPRKAAVFSESRTIRLGVGWSRGERSRPCGHSVSGGQPNDDENRV